LTANYDVQCTSYTLAANVLTCNACPSGYTLSDVKVGLDPTYSKHCLNNGGEVIPTCAKYTIIALTGGTLFYCEAGQCVNSN